MTRTFPPQRSPEARHAEVLDRVKEKATAAERLITNEEFLQLISASTRSQH
jgi:hypothetical protein